MNKISILLGFMTGFAGMMVFGKYKAAKRASRELEEYECLDSGDI